MTGTTGAITSLGIGTNGLNSQSIVDKLVAAAHAPIDQLNTQTQGLQTKLSALGQVQSALSALQDASQKLTDPSTWGSTTSSSSDTTSVSVSSSNGAAQGNVSVQVSQIAASQSLASAVQPGTDTVLGSGTLTIQLGTFASENSSFTAKTGTNPVTINIAGGSTLSQVRDQINAAQAGVVASIVTDSTGSRLVMRSSNTGQSNGFTVSVSDADGGNADATGLSALAYDPTQGASSATLTQSAANAQATLNGLSINSETNTLTQAIDGLNITLLKPTTGVSLTVAQDSSGISSAINTFATAYNAVASLLATQTKYDATTKTAGTLQGDSTAVNLTYALRNIVGGTSTLGGSSMSRLVQIGLDPQADGTLTVNATKITAALSDPTDLKAMFMGLDKTNGSNSGFAQQMQTFTTAALSFNGSLTTHQQGLQSQVTDNGKRADDLQSNLDSYQAQLTAQYQALDTQMSTNNSLAAYVSQQFGSTSTGSTLSTSA